MFMGVKNQEIIKNNELIERLTWLRKLSLKEIREMLKLTENKNIWKKRS